MNEKKDLLGQVLREEYERLAREEEKAVPEDIDMPDGMKDQLYAKIHGEIEELETEIPSALLSGEEEETLVREDMDLYAMLSEEDRKALELGRKIMEDEVRKEREGKVRRKKRRLQAYVGLAAALVLAMAFGVTTMGGPEKIIRIMTQMVGDREIIKIDSSEDNLNVVEENEELAYETLYDYFEIDLVRIMSRPENMHFVKMRLDEKGQAAQMEYEFGDQTIFYCINASYVGGSLGIDVEDKVMQKHESVINNHLFEIREYETDQKNTRRYSARYKYKGLTYFLIGVMERDEFEEIIENLYFY